jgi:hypothetical protein
MKATTNGAVQAELASMAMSVLKKAAMSFIAPGGICRGRGICIHDFAL